MKRIKLFSLLGFSLLALCCPYSLWASVEATFEEVVDFENEGKIFLENISGDVTVTSWKKDAVQIQARKVGRHESDLEAVTIEVKKSDDILKIMADYPDSHSRHSHVSINYELTIPKKASLSIKSVSGDIKVEKIGGSAELKTVSGEIEVFGIEKGLKCKSVSGEITAQDIVGETDLKTVSGRIRVTGQEGSVDAETVSGDIVLEKVSHAPEIEVKSVSGDISYHGSLNGRGNYEMHSHSGDIQLTLPGDSSFELNAKTFSGSIDCAFPITTSGSVDQKNFSGVAGKGGSGTQTFYF